MPDKSSPKERLTETKASPKRLIFVMTAAVLVLVGAILWFINISNGKTTAAVHDISEFYLEELATHVRQIFRTHFIGYSKEVRIAVEATKEAELRNEEDLRAHLREMAEKSGFVYYALMAEDGTVYISNDVYSNELMQSFMAQPEYNSYGYQIVYDSTLENEELFIVSVAVDGLTVNGKNIIAAAKGVSGAKMEEEILLTNIGAETLSHMILADGSYIIAGEHDHLSSNENYLDDLADVAKFQDGYSLEEMRRDMQNGESGFTAYYADGKLHYTYYAFLSTTGWYLVETVHYDTISGMLAETEKSIILSGILLMLLVLIVVSGIFFIYMRQRKRSAALHMEKLEAEERNRAKSTFLSSMSHDIRTPMNAIIGFTNLAMQHEDDTERVHEYLKKIRTSGNHLLSLINDVLDMSRIESGKVHLEETRCNLAEIFHEIHTIVQGQIESKQQHLFMDVINVTNEEIWCDKMRLNQVLLNLLSNAIKFTPAGGTISLIVRQKEAARAGYAAYEFHVKDTGIGMTQEFARKVFEPFEREQTAAVNKIQGTGLGMSIVKNIIDMMGGTICVETEQNKGTEFTVNVELKLQEDGAKMRPADIKELAGMRVLVVDDDFHSCDGMTRMLLQLGMDAEWTLSGREAILRIRQAQELGKTYQIFVIDWQLPDINGIEVVRQLRTAVGRDVPVLLMTSYSWTDVEEEAVQAGVTGFCSKPVFLSDLRRTLLEIVSEVAEEQVQEDDPVDFEGKRILLVEDNELNREIAVELFREYGFEIEEAEDGAVAVEKIRVSEPGHYDVVLMDIQMPVMNGYEAAQAIRKLEDPALANIPILAMTANAFEEDKQDALAAGMNGHITKPIDLKNLMEALGQVLHK